MKKRISLVFLLVLALGLSVIIGFTGISTTNTASSNNVEEVNKGNSKTIVENEAESLVSEIEIVESTTQTIQNENISIEDTNSKITMDEILSAEDRAVKSEISKYSNTKVDFRHDKQETIKGKRFDVTFSEIDSSSDYKRVIYKNNLGDEFVYNTDNGKLRYAVMESVITEKATESIDAESAQKIAVEYVSENCDINKYTMDQYKEKDSGYYFCFTRYIGGYPSSDRYSIQIGYDGAIVYVSDFTDTFDSKELNYSKEFIDSKIKEYSDETKVDWNSITICIHEGKVAVKYTELEKCAIAILPLE